MREEPELDAGGLAAWVDELQAALYGDGDVDVPCGGCTACCTSSQFVHIGPDEADARASIPSALLFAAPGMPDGHVLLGYDEHGRCPMLGDGGCSIYEHRPRTCRTYDCRVFPATGVTLDDADKAEIARRAGRWRFEVVTDRDHERQRALRASAAHLAAHGDELPREVAPRTPTQLAVLAVEAHALFVDGAPDAEAVRVAISAGRRRR